MDVPFLSSGAMSRAHYALVRKVELATAPAQVDRILLAEIETIRGRFARSASMKQTREYLVTLLYCFMTLEDTVDVDLEFALSHAVNLAEAGDTIQNKRIGYLYCAEMMPREHELQLMLVNTLRKDLESPDVARICLGLEALILSPAEDAIPAIQDRVHDLLSHNSAHVRRRALLSFRTLAGSNPDILRHVIDKMSNRLRDEDTTVVGAALSTCIPLLENGLVSKDKLRPLLIKQLRSTWKNVQEISSRWILLKYIEVLRITGLSRNAIEVLLDIVHTCSRHKPFPAAIVHECFQALSTADIDVVVEVQATAKTTFAASIRHLLLSQAPNDIYLFIACLNHLNSALWSGSKTDIPTVLEAWEVERVIALLDFPDVSIRKKTLQVLLKVDRSLVEAHYTRLLQVDRSLYTPLEKDDAAKRTLEVIHVLTDSVGEEYAHGVKTLIDVLQGDLSRDEPLLFESIVEDVLTHVRGGSVEFRSSCLGALFVLFDDDATKNSPTVTVILSALASEHLESSLLPPSHLLQGLASRLSSNGAAIQDALLLSMLRVAAECDQISDSVLATVRKIQEQAGRHIRRRCEQFITLSQARPTLRTILGSAKSSSLPDFMLALETYNQDHILSRATSPPRVAIERPQSRASSRASSHTPGKLRYTAYDAPKPTAKLRRVPSTSSVAKSDSSRFVGQDKEDALSRTITAGDLTLATEQIELQALTKSPRQTKVPSPPQGAKDDAPPKPDLIALDSPFLTEPPSAPTVSVTSSVAELDFEGVWNKLHGANLRGWCDSPIDVVVRRLQSIQRRMRVTAADQPPFQGDLKILICPELLDSNDQEGYAVVRLREGEEDSCLWHLRCEEGGLRSTIRTLLTDA